MDDLVEKMTECPICMEKLNDPKFLPCHHTFCCKCIEPLCSGFNGGLCPLCRSSFVAPYGHCSRLPTNAFAEQLVRVNGVFVETQINLNMLQTDFARVSAELESRVKELETDRSAARSTESRLRAEQREIAEKLKDAEHRYERAKTEVETCQSAMKEAEASLREWEKSGENLKHENDRLKTEVKRQTKGRPSFHILQRMLIITSHHIT